MISKKKIKAEIDKVHDEHLDVLYKIIKTLETPESGTKTGKLISQDKNSEWQRFVTKTYGCLADAPIRRGNQGEYDLREEFE